MTGDSLFPPVLFLIFNRPQTTQRVFREIRDAKPRELFIAADGPRSNVPGESNLCQKTREIVNQVDWDCKIHTLFREKNLGCRMAVSSAISWFFSHVEEGIILEDDCVPDQSFFPFCQALLERYRHDERVMMISGTNYLFNKVEIPESYFFSRYFPIWGWATWKRAWSLYDIEMADWPKWDAQQFLDEIYCQKEVVRYLRRMLVNAYSGQINTWDIQWLFSCIVNSGLAICPKYNLISNVGITGLHSKGVDKFHFMPVRPFDLSDIVHPQHVSPNIFLDRMSFKEIIGRKSLFSKIMQYFI